MARNMTNPSGHQAGRTPVVPVTASGPDLIPGDCRLCSWAWTGGRFVLKIVSPACAVHGRLDAKPLGGPPSPAAAPAPNDTGQALAAR